MQNKFSGYGWFLTVACFIIVVAAVSCSKHNQSADETGNICVTRTSPMVSDYLVSGANLDSIFALFSANNLSIANLQFNSWLTDTTTNIYPTAYSGYQEQVLATQFFNGLPVFAEDEFFTFNAGKFQPGGMYDGYTGSAPSADTTGHQTLPDLRNAFLAHVPQSFTEGGLSNAKPYIPSASTYIHSCLSATLGYLDASMVPGNTISSEKALIKVWRVTPSTDPSITYYPLIYVEDDNGAAWGVPFLIP
jgi:hypothetical protein